MMRVFFDWLLPASLAGGACALLLFAARPAFVRLGAAKLQKALCLVPLVLFCVLLPLPRSSGAAAVPAVGPVRQVADSPLPAPVAQAAEVYRAAVEAPAAGRAVFSWQKLTVLIWLAGAAALLLLLLADYLAFVRAAARQSAAPQDGGLEQLYRSVADGLGLQGCRLPRLRVSSRVGGPMLLGLLRPVILLPEGLPQDDDLRYALAHELCHWRAGDVVYKWAALLVAVLQWYNPAAWLLRRLVEQSCECACDAAVTRSFSAREKIAYGAALLRFHAARAPAPASGFSAAGRSLKRRLLMLMEKNTQAPGRRVLAVLLAAAVTTGGALTSCAASGMGESSSAPVSISAPGEGASSAAAGAGLSSPQAEKLLFPIAEGYKGMSRGFAGPQEHGGADLRAESGSEILAVQAGTVEDAGTDEENGLYVLLDHGGIKTFYAHCDELRVEAGQTVEQGQVIATVGNTGMSTGPHCHFEVRLDGAPVDPVPYLEQQPAETAPAEGTLAFPVGEGYGHFQRGFTGAEEHAGIDLAAAYGTSIYAAQGGVVTYADTTASGYGIHVIIDHGGGVQTLYGQCSGLAVSAGQAVSQGQVIAYVGNTGDSTGDHCHFEVRVDGVQTDPVRWFGEEIQTAYGLTADQSSAQAAE
ncbi:peptidoglycan DD-metalloendopeptidase family protein [Anaerofilum sp. BX8]|uniref:Peptidoglycan DD-metalloendopeptidase family protein n=1 Tax=Anaerofilum hominis TaxID=2763016 RepID=A0A923L0P1_9FIRM|nr:peptidoglycan DD-metalloendopeptidase family protein [Anaerofilum hominis]MBC5580835.1 peptidoglycan DD-metalloendopeptidase family protein [Anaerofilum hominis]